MKQVTKNALSRNQQIDIIWSQTHPDYRHSSDGVKCIMISQKFGGGLIAIENMTAEAFDDYLENAVRRKNRDTCKTLAVKAFNIHADIFSPLGLTSKDVGTINQGCGSFEDTRNLVKDLAKYDLKESLSDSKLESVLKTIDDLEQEFLA